MSPLLIGISAVVSLLIIAAVARTIRRQRRNTCGDRPGLIQEGRHVLAIITEVQIKQGWKVGERWERSLWDGTLRRQKNLADIL